MGIEDVLTLLAAAMDPLWAWTVGAEASAIMTLTATPMNLRTHPRIRFLGHTATRIISAWSPGAEDVLHRELVESGVVLGALACRLDIEFLER